MTSLLTLLTLLYSTLLTLLYFTLDRVNQGEGPEVEQAFWGYLGVAPEELPAAKARVRERSFLSGEDEDVDLVLYRVEDLQEELEGTTKSQKQGYTVTFQT